MNRARPTERKCEICGKKGKASNLLMCGGPFSYLCRDCRVIAEKVIARYLEMISTLPFHIVATTVLKHSKREVN